MRYQVGDILNVDGMECEVIGYIIYKNPQDGDKTWVDYRLRTEEGEHWLSCDSFYGEYSISRPSALNDGFVDYKWHKVDEGIQVVVEAVGDVDVEEDDRATFVDFEDETEEETLSLEMWDDGTEVSEGYYLDEEEIEILKSGGTGASSGKSFLKSFFQFLFIGLIVLGIVGEIKDFFFDPDLTVRAETSIRDYITGEPSYVYHTSITGQSDEKADVYYTAEGAYDTTQAVAENILEGIHGNVELATENQDKEDGSIAIVTEKEYCLIYYPEGKGHNIYLQLSNRKYNYTSDNEPYRSKSSTTRWYRSHYYSSAFSSDSAKWKNTPSAYTMYDGPIMKDLGNGYFDFYASSVRDSSIGNRNSSGGGLSGGK